MSKTIHVRLSENIYQDLKRIAASRGVSMAEVIALGLTLAKLAIDGDDKGNTIAVSRDWELLKELSLPLLKELVQDAADRTVRNAWLDGGTQGEREFAVRLALAHPERADEALGPGWEVRNDPKAGSVVLVWANWGVGCLEVRVDGGKTFVDTNGDSGVFELSPELLAAIARAQLIAAAWERVG